MNRDKPKKPPSDGPKPPADRDDAPREDFLSGWKRLNPDPKPVPLPKDAPDKS